MGASIHTMLPSSFYTPRGLFYHRLTDFVTERLKIEPTPTEVSYHSMSIKYGSPYEKRREPALITTSHTGDNGTRELNYRTILEKTDRHMFDEASRVFYEVELARSEERAIKKEFPEYAKEIMEAADRYRASAGKETHELGFRAHLRAAMLFQSIEDQQIEGRDFEADSLAEFSEAAAGLAAVGRYPAAAMVGERAVSSAGFVSGKSFDWEKEGVAAHAGRTSEYWFVSAELDDGSIDTFRLGLSLFYSWNNTEVLAEQALDISKHLRDTDCRESEFLKIALRYAWRLSKAEELDGDGYKMISNIMAIAMPRLELDEDTAAEGVALAAEAMRLPEGD